MRPSTARFGPPATSVAARAQGVREWRAEQESGRSPPPRRLSRIGFAARFAAPSASFTGVLAPARSCVRGASTIGANLRGIALEGMDLRALVGGPPTGRFSKTAHFSMSRWHPLYIQPPERKRLTLKLALMVQAPPSFFEQGRAHLQGWAKWNHRSGLR